MQPRFTDKRLKYRVTQAELLGLNLHSESNHALRHSQNTGITFEHGAGGFAQFVIDCYTRLTRINGLLHLGYPETFRPDQEKFPGEVKIKEQLATLLNIVNITEVDIDHIIAAHSQGPLGVIPFILGHAIHEPNDERDRIQFKQPHSQHIIFYRENGEEDSPIFARVQLDYFPISNYDGKTIGIMPGPVEVTYTLAQKNIGNEKDPELAWGYKLEYVETSNPDIVKAIKDEKFDPAVIRQSYCSSSQIEDFKTMVVRHAEYLYDLDASAKYIYPYVSEPNIEEVTTQVAVTPTNTKLGIFSRLGKIKSDATDRLASKFIHRK